MDLDKRITDLSISLDESMVSALKQMDQTHSKLLIVTKNDKYYSLVSIGDIQRAIIRNYALDTPIKDILRESRKIRVAREGDGEEKIRRTMLEHKTEFMPVIDQEGELVDIYFWGDIMEEERPDSQERLDVPIVIMAGGKGTRLKPITDIIPKALVPIADKPMIQRIVDRFQAVGGSRFIFSVNYKEEMIRQYFQSQEPINYDIEYIKEDEPLGTAGSLYMLKGKVQGSFFVSNCDILIDEDYREIFRYHRENENEMTLVAALKHYSIPYGTIETSEGGVLQEIREKPELNIWVNSGMYVLESHLLEEIPENQFYNITQLIESVRKRDGRIGVFPVSEKSWLDIGEWSEYNKTQEILKEKTGPGNKGL